MERQIMTDGTEQDLVSDTVDKTRCYAVVGGYCLGEVVECTGLERVVPKSTRVDFDDEQVGDAPSGSYTYVCPHVTKPKKP